MLFRILVMYCFSLNASVSVWESVGKMEACRRRIMQPEVSRMQAQLLGKGAEGGTGTAAAHCFLFGCFIFFF